VDDDIERITFNVACSPKTARIGLLTKGGLCPWTLVHIVEALVAHTTMTDDTVRVSSSPLLSRCRRPSVYLYAVVAFRRWGLRRRDVASRLAGLYRATDQLAGP